MDHGGVVHFRIGHHTGGHRRSSGLAERLDVRQEPTLTTQAIGFVQVEVAHLLNGDSHVDTVLELDSC